MYQGHKIIAIAPAYNEEQKISQVVARTPREIVDCLLVVDDGSTDRTAEAARAGGAEVLSLGKVLGVGSALRSGLQLARQRGFDIAVIMAGNNKDKPAEIPRLLDPIFTAGQGVFDRAVIRAAKKKNTPAEIPRLLDPICTAGQDLVIGSRFLGGGGYGGDMPAYRKLATRLHPWLMSLVTRKRLTETTNGF